MTGAENGLAVVFDGVAEGGAAGGGEFELDGGELVVGGVAAEIASGLDDDVAGLSGGGGEDEPEAGLEGELRRGVGCSRDEEEGGKR